VTVRPAAFRRLPPRRGVALVVVLAVVAIASVLGYVMLSTASMQNRAGSNHARRISADYLAESGINIAMYYLQYPDRAPARNADGYWGGSSADYTLPNGYPSNLVISVTRDASDPWTYEVIAVGTVGVESESSSSITRTAGARVYVRNEYVMKPGAMVANNSFTIAGPVTSNGDVYSAKHLAMKVGTSTPVVNGAGYAPTAMPQGVGWSQPRDGYRPLSNSGTPPIAPTNSEINLYKTYTLHEQPHDAELLGAITSLLENLLGILHLQPTESNPGGVIYKDARSGGAFVLGDNVHIDGTLVVEGDLQIKGANIVITPKPGFPALIVTGNVEIFQNGKSLTANGATYIGNQLKSNGTPTLPALTSTMTVNGGLIFGTPSGAPIASGYNVKTVLNFNAAKAKAPELSTSLRSPKGVSIVRWGLP
jgi:Tfp pilus assembly protein PilX